MKAILCLAGFAVAVVAPCLCAEEPETPYLMSVSFSVPHIDKWTQETLDQFLASPYQGIGARMPGAYARDPAPKLEDFAAAVKLIKGSATPGRHVWPWIFLNRIIAPNPERSHRSASKKPVDVGFKGIDLDGSGGALDELYAIWRMSLRLARELGAPGIVLDPEAYSDYGIDNVRYLATLSGKSPEETIGLIRGIGARLADITAEEFPNAIVWTLFTHIETDPDVCTATTLFFDGLLMKAKEKNIPLVVVDGGETVGYAFINMENLTRHHKLRAMNVADALQKYAPHLVMGCTIAPWAEAKERTSWMNEWPSCVNSTFKTIGDFEPVFVELLRRYTYFWIYAASAAPYNPLAPQSAGRYNPTIVKALAEAKRLGPLPPYEVPKLSDLKTAAPITTDLTADATLWTVSGGPEASMSTLPEPSAFASRFGFIWEARCGSACARNRARTLNGSPCGRTRSASGRTSRCRSNCLRWTIRRASHGCRSTSPRGGTCTATI